jgi:hypothetical protein
MRPSSEGNTCPPDVRQEPLVCDAEEGWPPEDGFIGVHCKHTHVCVMMACRRRRVDWVVRELILQGSAASGAGRPRTSSST